MQFFAVIKLYLLQIFDDGYLHVVQLMQYVLLRTLHHHHFGTHTRIYWRQRSKKLLQKRICDLTPVFDREKSL